jgi:hypothetical protein
MTIFRRRIVDIGLAGQVGAAGSLSATVQMGIQPMVRGYVFATRRLRDAVNRSDALDIYAALFEVSSWLDSLSERDAGLNGRDDVQAAKFARNRTHHQWASGVQNDGGEWRWRPLENLPVPDDPKHRNTKLEPVYQRRLERNRVVEVFDRLERFVVALAPGVDLS